MNQANPYAPPLAHVADVAPRDAGTQPVRIWAPGARIGRLRYLAHMVVAYVLLFIVSFIGGFVGAAGIPFVGDAAIWIGVAVYVVFMVLKTIQRSHDMDWTGWSSILALIPLVGLIWLFVPGTQGSNRFGAPTPPNTLGVKILGLLLPAIFVIGIIAAVGIPAYAEYSKRVEAARGG